MTCPLRLARVFRRNGFIHSFLSLPDYFGLLQSSQSAFSELLFD